MAEVGGLARRADAAGKRLPTLAIDTEIRFRSAEDRAAFAEELTAAVVDLVPATTTTTAGPTASSSPPTPTPERNP